MQDVYGDIHHYNLQTARICFSCGVSGVAERSDVAVRDLYVGPSVDHLITCSTPVIAERYIHVEFDEGEVSNGAKISRCPPDRHW